MAADDTKLQFYSGLVADKIAAYSMTADSSPPTVSSAISYSIPGSGLSIPDFTLNSLANPYGKKCLTTLIWSLDNVNWYDQDDSLGYVNGAAGFQVKMQVSCGCSDSTIYFFFQSSYTSTQTVYIQFALDSPS